MGADSSAPTPRVKEPVVSSIQCRAARALLGWSQRQLASEARVARKTVTDLEVRLRPLRYRTRLDITRAFERHGIEFVWPTTDRGEGVRFRSPDPGATRAQAAPQTADAAD
jgi:DNA-binding XRE family transcriptional regulator